MDQIERKAALCKSCKELPYRLYRLYKFEISDSETLVNFGEMEYQKVARVHLESGEKQTYLVEEDLEIDRPNASIFIFGKEGWRFEPPQKIFGISLTVSQAIGDNVVTFSKSTDVEADTKYFSLDVFANIESLDKSSEEKTPEALLEISCIKK